MPEISVIVPVYNVEPYLNRCVDSILGQTFTDFELLLVDDGTPDNSGDICDEYSLFDTRVISIHKPNGGVSSARNYGIDYTKGRYISFIDSDDWVENEYLATFDKYESDLTLAAHSTYDEEGNLLWSMEYDDRIYQTIEDIDFLYLCDKMFSPYCRLFKTDIIINHGIRFPLGITWGEDSVFGAIYSTYIKNATVLSYKGYHYIKYKNEESLSSKVRIDIIDMITFSRSKYLSYMRNKKEYQLIKKVVEADICGNCAYFVRKLFMSNMKYHEKSTIFKCFSENEYVKMTFLDTNRYYGNKIIEQSILHKNPIKYYEIMQNKIKIEKHIKKKLYTTVYSWQPNAVKKIWRKVKWF